MQKPDTKDTEIHPMIANAGREGSGDHMPLISIEDIGPLVGAALCLFMLVAITYYVFFQPSPFQKIYNQFSQNAKKVEQVEKVKTPPMMPAMAIDSDLQKKTSPADENAANGGR